jgi:hypothetical protein
LPQNVCKLQDLTLCQLYCPVEWTHGIEVFTVIQELTQPLQKLLQNFRLNICWGKYGVTGLTLRIRRCGLSEQ